MAYEEIAKKLEGIFGPQLVNDLREQINKIENNIPATKYHYGDYMALLSQFGSNKENMAKILIVLGANAEGVTSALKLV
jgi:hypothetical protein